jgi:hypothetical protein
LSFTLYNTLIDKDIRRDALFIKSGGLHFAVDLSPPTYIESQGLSSKVLKFLIGPMLKRWMDGNSTHIQEKPGNRQCSAYDLGPVRRE